MDTIKALRERAELLQKDIAIELRLCSATVSSWERGRTEPNSKQMVQLCEILKCTPYELLGMEQQ